SLPWTPKSPYGVSKRCVIDYLVAYRDMYDLEFSALALANVYGPRQDPLGEGGVIAIFGKNLAEGRQSTINGDGEYTRDFVFVDDVVDAFSRAAERGGGLVLNIASGKETSINALYDVMAAHVPAPAPPRHGPQRAGDVRRSCLDPGRAGIHLGWKPWTSLAEGTRAVIESFEQAG
ncbi:MAG TPA: NAD-dependent epimerase/dehydratase family protein, partial [Acidimicrobiales bacterium]|nr:NAD-dependent epimerase/dehydratase family protein [Acidimicrobiales bacterium]